MFVYLILHEILSIVIPLVGLKWHGLIMILFTGVLDAKDEMGIRILKDPTPDEICIIIHI